MPVYFSPRDVLLSSMSRHITLITFFHFRFITPLISDYRHLFSPLMLHTIDDAARDDDAIIYLMLRACRHATPLITLSDDYAAAFALRLPILFGGFRAAELSRMMLSTHFRRYAADAAIAAMTPDSLRRRFRLRFRRRYDAS